MSENEPFKKPTHLQLAIVFVLLGLGCLIEASDDWVRSSIEPSMTLNAILIDTLALLLIGLLIGVPVAMLLWNKLVVPIFGVPKLRYVHALVLVTVACWFNGL